MDESPKPTPPTRRISLNEVIQIQSIYFNAFELGLTNADVSTMLFLNGQPVGQLQMSFTTAKTLQKMLGEIIAHLEKATGKTIMTTEIVGEGLAKAEPVQR